MSDTEDKKVQNLLQYSLSVLGSKRSPTTPIDRDVVLNTDRKYEWVMQQTPRHLQITQFPSITWESDDIKECSAYHVADEVLKSHIYNIRCAMKSLFNPSPFIIWVDYDFFSIKDDPNTIKVSTEKMELTTGQAEDEEGRKKTRSFHYWRNQGRSIALSPAIQAFRFINDEFLIRHGITLKCEKLPFVRVDREVRYLEMDPKLFFTEEPWSTLEVAYFKTPNRMTAMAIKQKKRERCAGDPDDQGILTIDN